MKYVFKDPYEFEGKTYTEIDVAVENLRGSDLKSAIRRHFGPGAQAPVLDPDVREELLAKASGQPVEFFQDLPVVEYGDLSQLMLNFLLKQGWGEQTR